MKLTTKPRPSTIEEYIQAAPIVGQAHLRQLYEVLKSVAPQAEETLKWNTPFFVEPRFLFAFSAHKSHLSFAPIATAFTEFSAELSAHRTTKGTLAISYQQPLPVELIGKIAQFCVQTVTARQDEAFW